MKFNCLLIASLVCGISFLYAQETRDSIFIPQEYARSKKAPLTVESGTVIVNEADKLYLVNEIRHNYYEELRQLVNSNVDEDIESIVLKYEKILKENDLLFDSLEEKCKEQSVLYKNTIDDLKLSLNDTSKILDLSQKSLENANSSIELGLKQISYSRKKRFWNSLGFIGGGVSIGLIAGILIAN